MSNRRRRENNGNNGHDNEEIPLQEQVAILEDQVKELKATYKKDVGNLKAALQVAHNELTTSNTDLKKSFKTDIDLLHRMTLELHTLCQRNAAAQGQESASTIEKLAIDKNSASFGDVLGPVPSPVEYRLQEIENLLKPLHKDLLILSDATRDSQPNRWEDEEDPKEPKSRFLNIGNMGGEEGDEVELETDIFSIFIISKNCSASFFYPLIIAVSQYSISILILVDLLWDNEVPVGVRRTWGNVPIKVNPQVVIAQFFSLIIAFVTVDDMITSLRMFLNGYDIDIQKQNPGASYCKFILANSIRFFEGMFTIAVSALIIIQADNVLDIFMNFAAVAFVSELDNIAFGVAENGLCGRELEEACEKVQETRMKVQARGNCVGWALNGFFVLLFAPFLLILLLARIRQSNGYYLSDEACNNVEVQFGDEMLSFDPNVRFSFVGEGLNKTFDGSTRNLPFLEDTGTPHRLLYQHFSAVYEAESEENADRLMEFNSRPIYWERGFKDPTSGKFYYCDAIKSWVFTIEALHNTPGAIPKEARDECQFGWLMQSPVTSAFTLEEAPMRGWNIWTGDVEEASLDFLIKCNDCDRNSDCGLTHGICDQDTSTCNCNDDWQGARCHLRKPFCWALIGMDYGESSFDYMENRPYTLGLDENNQTLMFYQRPMYTFPWFVFDTLMFEVIMYTGRRWFVTYWLVEDLDIIGQADIDPHAYWDNILGMSTAAYSDPTESYYPIGVKWHEVRTSRSRGSFGAFFASHPATWKYECLEVDCMDDDSICGHYGTCVEGMEEPLMFLNFTVSASFPRNYCKCNSNYGGFFCEYDPEGEYSSAMYQEYILDPVAYYNNNNESQYLKYWVGHYNETMKENVTIEFGAGDGEL